MAAPDFFSQLPSLDELLEHPRVAAAIERVNQSSAAARVRTAVSGLSAEVTRRAEELQGLTPGEILDRVVRRIDEPARPTASHTINATGVLFGAGWTATPLPPTAIDAAHVAAESFHEGSPQSAAQAARKLVGAEAARVFTSHASALAITLEALARGGVCVIARREMTELAGGVRLDEVCRRAGVDLREVGAADHVTIDDYRAAADGGAVILRRTSVATDPSVRDLASIAGATVVVDAGPARLREDTPAYGAEAASAASLLADGAKAVVLDAAGTIGGPPAGVLVGEAGLIDAVAQSAAGRLDAMAPTTDAALAATVELFDQPDRLRFGHPLYQLLDAPIDNLRTRAERMGPQIAAAEGVAAAEPIEIAGTTPSWGVRVTPVATEPTALAEQLAQGEPRIVTRVEGSAVVIDLRSVFPREDRVLVEKLGPQAAEAAPTAD